ncbi:hypothetical protein [Halalkalicoccus tibetensis]|uniref:COG1361 S-layer family protein n=1 Tax=Halalkalicoccus tibetensis TaxID=175632 RepID=A0ABD5V3P5_9EURY
MISGIAFAQAEGSPAFEAYAPDNTVAPGEETSLTVTFENQGEITTEGEEIEEATVTEARGVTAELDSGGAPISVQTDTAPIGTVQEGATGTQSFDITVNGDANPGTYEVPIELEYSYTPEADEDGDDADEVTTTETVTVDLVVDEGSQFEIEGATSDVVVGDSGDSTIDITNTGPGDASQAVVTLDAPDTNVDVTSQSQQIYVGDWAAGETQAINFVTELSDDALPQDTTLNATVEYLDESDNERSSRELRTAIATGDQQAFSVDDVESELYVGENGQVTGQVTNDGPNAAENVVLLLGDGGGDGEALDILGDVGGGPGVGLGENVDARESQFSVGSLDPGESAEFEFPMAVSSEAEPGPREVEVTTRYRNVAGDVQTTDPIDMSVEIDDEREVFTVERHVAETDEDAETETETETDDETAEDTFEPGATDTLEIAVTNDYDQTLTNLRAQAFTNDPLSIDDDEVFIGEIEPGETEVLEFDLEVGEGADPQTYPVEMDFQYDDEDDSDQLSDTYRVPVTVAETEDDGLGWLLVIIAVIALLAAIVWWFRDDVREWYHSLDRP